MVKETIILGEIDISSLLKAKESFDIALEKNVNDLTRDGCIQRFEYSFELAWKMLKRVLAFRGVKANSPREVFRLAAKENLITDPTLWFEFLEKRNETAHIYNEDVAQDVFDSLPSFQLELEKVIETLKGLA